MDNKFSAKQKYVKNGVAAAIGCCIFTVIYYIFGELNSIMSPFFAKIFLSINIIFFLMIAWGIWKLFRIAAFSGLVIFLIERIFLWWYQMAIPIVTIITTFIIVLLYIRSIRDIYRYRMDREETGSGLNI